MFCPKKSASHSKCKLSLLLRRCDILKITSTEWSHLVLWFWTSFSVKPEGPWIWRFQAWLKHCQSCKWLGVKFVVWRLWILILGNFFFSNRLAPRWCLLFFCPTLMKQPRVRKMLTNGSNISDEVGQAWVSSPKNHVPAHLAAAMNCSVELWG